MMVPPLAFEIAAGLGAAAGLAAGACAYAALWPASQIFGKALLAPARPGELALTFDDGPNPLWTPQLLEMLDRHKIQASFFMVGRYAQKESTLVKEMAAAGHLIGNHSWSHPNLAMTASDRVREELRRTTETLEEITGAPIRFFRPPFGARRPTVLKIAKELGMMPVLWNAMTTDWSEPSSEKIAAALTLKIDRLERKGYAANIVLHDGGHLEPTAPRGPSVAAATQLVERYKSSHIFVTLDAWG